MIKREKVIVSAYTGVLMCKFKEVHKYAEEVFGRPIQTFEFASEEMEKQLRDYARAEFIKICEEE